MAPPRNPDHRRFGPKVTFWISTCLNLFKWSIVSACLLCLIIQGSRCIERYLEKDSRIIQNLRASKDVTFIAFTICPSFDDAYNGTMLEVHGTNKDIYKRGSTKQPPKLSTIFPSTGVRAVGGTTKFSTLLLTSHRQGRRKLSKARWASHNAAHQRCRRRILFCQNLGGQLPTLPTHHLLP